MPAEEEDGTAAGRRKTKQPRQPFPTAGGGFVRTRRASTRRSVSVDDERRSHCRKTLQFLFGGRGRGKGFHCGHFPTGRKKEINNNRSDEDNNIHFGGCVAGSRQKRAAAVRGSFPTRSPQRCGKKKAAVVWEIFLEMFLLWIDFTPGYLVLKLNIFPPPMIQLVFRQRRCPRVTLPF